MDYIWEAKEDKMNGYEKRYQIMEWLKDYDAYKAAIENLQSIINDVAEEGMGIAYDKEPISPTYNFSSMTENAVIKLDKLNTQIRMKAMQNTVNAIDKGMAVLSDIEREVIKYRCIKGQYYYQFCYKVCCSERTARRIKRQALEKMSIVIFGN